MVRGALTALSFAFVLGGTPGIAAADSNDLVLARLATKVTAGGTTSYVAQNLEFRALASQLGVALAPELLTPADTLGFGGFQFDVTGSQTVIDAKQSYWRARESSPDPAAASGAGYLRTIGVFAHKGLWFPLPSFEAGVGAVHLMDSSVWTAQLDAKIGLHEGYHDLPIPSVSVRGSVSRMLNQRELDLTTASLDVTVSKHFGVGGTWRLDPFAGWNLLFIVPRSEVIDATPSIDPLAPGNEMDSLNNFVFKDQATILRHRIFVGAKFQYAIVQLTAEVEYAFAGSSVDDREGTSTPCMVNSTTTNCDAKDTAAAQTTVSFSAGLDF